MGLSQDTGRRPMANQDPVRLEKRVSPFLKAHQGNQSNKFSHYLLRHEIISVHATEGLPQIYPVCIQINLSGSGTTVPKATYKFPDIYNNFDTTFENFQTKANWDEFKPAPDHEFVAPGPPLYDGSGGGNSISKRTGTGAPLKTSPGEGAAIEGKPADTYILASTPAGTPVVGASTIADPSVPTAGGVSAQPDVSAVADPYATAISDAPIAGASSVPNPIGSAAAVSSVPAGPAAADPANPAPSVDIKLSNKGVVNNAAAGGDAAAVKSLPVPSVGNAAADAGQATSAIPSANAGVASASEPSATALAAGADSPVVSVTSDSAAASAATGTSDYASNIQGGACQVPSWRCQKYANGTDFLEVCDTKKIDVVSGGIVYGQYLAIVDSILMLTL